MLAKIKDMLPLFKQNYLRNAFLIVITLFCVGIIILHINIQKSISKSIDEYINRLGLSSHISYGSVRKTYFPPSIKIRDIFLYAGIDKVYKWRSVGIEELQIASDNKMVVKGLNFDLLDIIKAEYNKDSSVNKKEYPLSHHFNVEEGLFKRPYISLFASGYRDIKINAVCEKFNVEGTNHINFDIKVNNIGDFFISIYTNKNLTDYLQEFITKEQNLLIGNVSFPKLFNSFEVQKLSIVFEDKGLIDNYKEFVAKYSLSPKAANSDTVNYMIGTSFIRELLEKGVSSEKAEQIENAFNSVMNNADTIHMSFTSDTANFIEINSSRSYLEDLILKYNISAEAISN